MFSEDFFTAGKDDIVIEGSLYKFKPGLSNNFQQRHVQVSNQAFRYFQSKSRSYRGKPIVAVRKKCLDRVEAKTVERSAYVKPGSKIFKSGIENKLFDNMFEIVFK